jgi:hypothetical protein
LTAGNAKSILSDCTFYFTGRLSPESALYMLLAIDTSRSSVAFA